MKNIVLLLKLLFTAAFVGINRVLDPVPELAKRYLRGLLQLATVTIILPVPFALLGILTGWLWLTACAGLWSTAWFAVLCVWGSPIGILIDALIQGKSGSLVSGKRYVSAVRGIILWEALTYWVLSLVPIRDHWELVPLCALSVVCLVLMTYHWEKESDWVRPIFWYSGIGVVALCLAAFIFPNLTWSNAWHCISSETATLVAMLSLPSVQKPLAVIAGAIIAATGLLCLCRYIIGVRAGSAGTPVATADTTHGHGSGGEKSGLGTLAAIVMSIVAVGIIAAVAILNNRQSQATSATFRQPLPRNDTYALTKDVWTPVTIGAGIDAVWHAPDRYFYRYNNEPTKYEDRPDITIKMPKRRGPYTVYFRAKETPTTVSVFQTAMP